MCHFGPPQTLTRTEKAAKSNHSRTSRKFSRKSNHSRTYAKTGGGVSRKQLSATSYQRSGGKKKAVPSPSFCCSPLATRRSPPIPIISAPLATAALRIVPAPIFTTTLSIHCRRADNFAAADDKRQPKSGPPPRPGRGKRQDGPYTRRRNPRTDLKIGHYIGKPRRRETQDPPSQSEDGAPSLCYQTQEKRNPSPTLTKRGWGTRAERVNSYRRPGDKRKADSSRCSG